MEAWREYTTLIRSCVRLPPTHFVSLNFPWTYYGDGSTAVVNRFCQILRRRLGRGVSFFKRWRYDVQTKGRWPHLHLLVRCSADITLDDVRTAWRAVWPGEEMEDSSADVVPIMSEEDVYAAVSYFVKHGQPAKRIDKRYWHGRATGGDHKFLVASAKALMREDHYRAERDTRSLWLLEEELASSYPWLCGPADTSIMVGQSEAQAVVDSSLLPNSSPVPLPAFSRSTKPKDRRYFRSILRYAVWINAPDQDQWVNDEG